MRVKLPVVLISDVLFFVPIMCIFVAFDFMNEARSMHVLSVTRSYTADCLLTLSQ